MIQTGFDQRVQIQQIIDSQLPEFVLDESPKTSEFLKQYYISQEYQGGPVDIADNLDQYLNLDTLIPEVVVDNFSLTANIDSTTQIISVTSTKGFPQRYGLLKVDDEIITYTGITTNTFTGCIRGFSGVTNYHKELQYEELVFSESTASFHATGSEIKNLSSLFLREFYKKIKFSLSPGLEELEFTKNLNVGNFIKEARTLYQSKGTEESFRILFNVLFGETPKIIDLKRFLIKSSDANYIRREVAVIEVISGDASKLQGQTIKKSTDDKTSASVSEVETITRKGKTYYKLNCFIGYDDTNPNVTGTFSITPSTKIIEDEIINFSKDNSSVISVDSTIGFSESGSIFYSHPDYDDLIEIFYTQKSINQFFGCYTNLKKSITVLKTSNLISNETYYGYEDGDEEKKVEFRITGVLSDLVIEDDNYNFFEGDEIYPQNVGEIISNGTDVKQIFANSWIYNTSSRYQVDSFSGNIITTKSIIDASSLSVGDKIELLGRNNELKIDGFEDVTVNSVSNNQITIDVSTASLNTLANYDIRRKLKKASSIVPIEFGNNKLISDVHNVYSEKSDYAYVASNSLPSYLVTNNIFEYSATELVEENQESNKFEAIQFNEIVSFITGDKVFYYTDQNSTIEGLEEGIYYVEVLRSENIDIDRKKIRLYLSNSSIVSNDYLSFGKFSNGLITGNHNFVLYSQRSNTISPQKILKKFKLNQSDAISENIETIPGSIGMLKNGVEIYNYKSNDKVYYGPIENVKVLNGGVEYDVINPPILNVSSGNALIQPVVIGSLEKIYVDPQEFDIDVVVSIALTGGNGSGAKFEPVIEKYSREIEFDARPISFGGGLDFSGERIVFTSNHNLINGQEIIYNSNNNNELGIGLFNGSNLDQSNTLINTATYYPRIINDKTIELYQSYSDYISGINTVGFTTIGNSGIHKFKTYVKRKLSSIKVIDGGGGYSNRKLIVKPSGISTFNHTIEYTDHGFSDGEIVTYTYESNGISGLSTTNKYKILKINSDKFRLCNAGIDGTDISNYERKNYVKFTTIGTGYQFFSYPDISLSVEYSTVGLGSTQVKGSIVATPIIRGEISQVYVYEKGNDYGSTILNIHRRPQIIIKNGKEAQLKPIVKNGRIADVQVLYGGKEYYSTPDLIVSGNGVGSLVRPIIENNKIVDVVVINPGAGYISETTSVRVISAGRNAVFQSNIRPLTLNNSYKYGIQNINFRDPASEVLVETKNNLEYAVIGYSQSIKNNIGDPGNNNTHSDIIGWAYDGNPIYGSFGYSDPNSRTSIKKLESGYTIVDIENRPSTEIFPIGYFVEDYGYTANGDLDQYNGRFAKTKDFPEGIYAYFATTENNINANSVGKFPYFIGNSYRSQYLNENINLNQSFDFNNSNLLRNTYPYKVNDPYADNDFIIESNEIIEQKTLIESVSSGSVSSFQIFKSGTDYSVGDALLFDNDGVGEGISAEVSEITGKEIVNIDTIVESYNDSIIEWENENTIKIYLSPYHNFSNKDNINISGLSTQFSKLNGSYRIGLTTYSSTLDKDIDDYSITGIVTDIYVSSIPDKVSIGSSMKIENEIFSILNIYPGFNVLRVKRDPSGISHTQSTPIYFLPNSLTVNKLSNYFESKSNSKVYYNPTKSVGIGITPGIGINVDYNVGITTYNTFIPSQSIFLPNHPFTTNQQVIFKKPSGSSPIAVSNTPTSSAFNIMNGNSEVLYVINKSKDYIGIVTSVGLTTNTNGLFLRSSGTNNFEYSIESNFTQIKVKVNKINSVVSVSTSHNLKIGDEIKLNVKPNLSVGIGTSSFIQVKLDSLTQKIILNPITFNSSRINTSNNSIAIYSHNLNTGDKIIYETLGTIPAGLVNGSYFTYKIDEDNIKLCETYEDVVNDNPNFVDIISSGSGSHIISIINPQIKSIKNNNLVFDLSDSSLIGYTFKVYQDKNFKKDFVSSPNTDSFSIVGIGTIGISTIASLTLNYSDSVPEKLYYNIEKSGYINPADTEVVNYSEISFIDSSYNANYTVVGSGNTTFSVSLKQVPENLKYQQDDCDILEYRTNSPTAFGGVSKIRLLNGGYGYKKLPLFNGINSDNGSGAFIIPTSNTIGKIKQSRIINEGFEYSSDKTLRPTASVPKLVYISSSNTIDTIDILNGGKNYSSPPDLILIDSDSGELIDSGFLRASLSGSSITGIIIENEPKGLPTKPVTIRAINNSNGISIDKVYSSSSGIVTCILTTPISGFTAAPFAIGDKIFVEGIVKYDFSKDGFNSSDYGYQFFTVKDYDNLNPAKLEFNLSELSTNPGIAKTIQESYASIVNYKNYPLFKITQKFLPFLIGEKLSSDNGIGYVERDLIVTNCEKNYIKVSGSYVLSENERIRGLESSSEASIDLVDNANGIYNITYFNRKNLNWKLDTGKLSEDRQVMSDNDYYQNLSYSIKSTKTWEEIVTPVNSLLHMSGMKNFADMQILEKSDFGIESIEPTISLVNMYISDNRVDTINNFDLVVDSGIIGDKSKFLKFKNISLTDYILCKTNRVLKIDDISSEFSSSDDERTLVSNILPINSGNGYNRFLVQIKNIENNQTQFSEIVSINNQSNIYTLSKATITNIDDDYTLAEIKGYVDEDSEFYLRFEPKDPYDSNFEIKILQDTFISKSSVGSTQSVGFVDLISQNKTVPSGITTSIFSLNSSKYSSIYSNIHLLTSDSSDMNYVEIYITHDGTNTYISEYYFDDEDLESYELIGSFNASIDELTGILSLNYTNTSSNSIIVRSKNVGFGTTAVGSGFYRFKLPGQINTNERSVVFESNFTNVSSGSTSVLVLDKTLFTSAKSIVKVGLGETSALHQIMTICDGTDSYITQYPFLSVGSTSGIGSFGSEISETDFILKFYPDSSVSGNIEILSFNECFYTDLDTVNVPPDLIYSPVRQSVKVSKYFGLNSPFVSKLDFDARYQNQPIFMKTFDPTDSSVLDPATGVFTIPNHFFSTGERLIYTPKSTFIGIGTIAMGIGSTENYVGIVTNILPSVVYAIKENNFSFKLATKKEYAEQGIGVTFTSYGLGNAHQLEMFKKNEKSLITINNLTQYPISYSNINHTLSGNGGQIGTASTIFSLSGISSINPTDLLKIDDEYVRVENVGFGTTTSGIITFNGDVPLVEVRRGFVGSVAGIHTDTTNVSVYRGSYNISENKIFFTQPPRGNQLDLIGPDEGNLPRERATFTGRVFLRQDYTSNQIYDDISDQFTGVGQTFVLTSQGINTVGLGASGGNGVVFINNIFQSPTTLNNSNNNYFISEDTISGVSSVTFTGIASNTSNDMIYISDYDINMNQLPRGGIIVSIGSTSGLGYAPLVGASVTSVVGAGGSIISVGLGTQDILGSGYRSPVSVSVTEEGHSGNEALISVIVGLGGTLSFTVIDGGTGYSNPTINVSSPSYENLPITGISRLGVGATTETGIGLLLNVEVGASSTTTGIGSTLFEVTSFKITRNGYGFRRGDIFKPVGLVTDKNLSSPISEFELTVLDTFTDSFGAWQFGELDYIDSIKNYQDGVRVRFPLFYNSELISFETDEDDPDSQLIDLDSVLLIFVNGIQQEPGDSYQFSGGSSFIFKVPPKPEDNVSIFFYRGTVDEDSLIENVTETIKVGDTVQVFSNNGISNTIIQNKRTVVGIPTSDIIETNLYNQQGIDTDNQKPLYWTKQKVDLVINGEFISKSRDSIESQIYPTASIIKDFNTTSPEIFVDDVSLFDYENQSPINFDANIFANNSGEYETITDISNVEGFNASIIGIASTTGIGVPLAIKFTLSKDPFVFSDIQVGYPVYISGTKVGSGVTSINSNNSDVISISTSHLNNIYQVHSFDPITGIMTCNVLSNTSVIGISTTGTLKYPVGKLSWGRLSGFTRSSSPISIEVSGHVSSIGITSTGYGAGLSTYPIIQRRGYGLRNSGALVKITQ